MSRFEHLICPVCHQKLLKTGQTLICSSRHSFDIASKGYANLLLSQYKNSKDPGDNKEMAKARKRFLDKGYYEALARGLSEVFTQIPAVKEKESLLLDAGCGDGYYTNFLQRSFAENNHPCSVLGMDISKEAIRLAAGRNKEITFLVASLFKLPFETSQADLILNAFAPACDGEFVRALKKNGNLVTVIPGKRHLFELKSILYDEPYENDEKEPDLPSFQGLDQVRIKSTIYLDSHEDLADLLAMTPYSYRTPREGIERLNQLDCLEIAIEFIIGIHSPK